MEHILNCEKFLVPLTITKQMNKSRSRAFLSSQKEFLSPLTNCISDMCKTGGKYPLHELSINEPIIEAVTSRGIIKKSKNNFNDTSVSKCKVLHMPKQFKASKSNSVSGSMNLTKLIYKKELNDDFEEICEYEMDSRFDRDSKCEKETKIPELGGKEGSVLVPRVTLKSLPHFSEALGFR